MTVFHNPSVSLGSWCAKVSSRRNLGNMDRGEAPLKWFKTLLLTAAGSPRRKMLGTSPECRQSFLVFSVDLSTVGFHG